MARKKKADEEIEMYIVTGSIDNLIRISWKYNVEFSKLKELNPEIKGPAYSIRMGQKVRIK